VVKSQSRYKYKKYNALYMRKYFAEVEKPEHREKRLEYMRTRSKSWRNKVFTALGNKCINCGFEDKRALQIDHINGGGIADRKRKGGHTYMFYKQILSESDFKENYQILCANCNWIKKVEKNEVAHGIGSKPRKYLN